LPLKRTGLTEPVTFGPNVNGYFALNDNGTSMAALGRWTCSGGFSTGYSSTSTAAVAKTTGPASTDRTMHLNAYDSNSIYVANGKVYPLSLSLNYIIKA